jgi:Leucine-rich repeat (LRR) protein
MTTLFLDYTISHFSNLTNLKYLHLFSNQLNQIDFFSFSNLTNLWVFDLSRNRFKVLINRQNFLTDLGNLLRLNLSSNMVDRIDESFLDIQVSKKLI